MISTQYYPPVLLLFLEIIRKLICPSSDMSGPVISHSLFSILTGSLCVLSMYQFWYLTKCSSQASRLTQFDIKYHFEEQKLIDTTYYTSGESHGYRVTTKSWIWNEYVRSLIFAWLYCHRQEIFYWGLISTSWSLYTVTLYCAALIGVTGRGNFKDRQIFVPRSYCPE